MDFRAGTKGPISSIVNIECNTKVSTSCFFLRYLKLALRQQDLYISIHFCNSGNQIVVPVPPTPVIMCEQINRLHCTVSPSHQDERWLGEEAQEKRKRREESISNARWTLLCWLGQVPNKLCVVRVHIVSWLGPIYECDCKR